MPSEKKKPAPMYKFLGENMRCLYSGEEYYYPAPTWNPKTKAWTPTKWLRHPKPDAKNKEACGVGYHLAKVCCPRWGRYTGNAYLAEGRGLLGEDDEKARYREVRIIRPLRRDEIFHPGANLSGANLFWVDLSLANLSRADLSWVDLSGADLSGADLSGADLSWVDLSRANLSRANLSGANLSRANLSRANLSRADLSGAYGRDDWDDLVKRGARRD